MMACACYPHVQGKGCRVKKGLEWIALHACYMVGG